MFTQQHPACGPFLGGALEGCSAVGSSLESGKHFYFFIWRKATYLLSQQTTDEAFSHPTRGDRFSVTVMEKTVERKLELLWCFQFSDFSHQKAEWNKAQWLPRAPSAVLLLVWLLSFLLSWCLRNRLLFPWRNPRCWSEAAAVVFEWLFLKNTRKVYLIFECGTSAVWWRRACINVPCVLSGKWCEPLSSILLSVAVFGTGRSPA